MSPRPVAAAVVGLGVGAEHARAFARTEGSALRVVCDLDARKAEALVAEIGQGRVARSFEEVLADPEVDLVSVATYDDAHAAQVVAALSAGKHVLCEKPLCRTADELAAVRAAWRASGRHLRCNLVLRAAPAFQWLGDAIRSGALGLVYAFDGDYLYGRLHKITGGWRKDVRDYSVLAGGGVHLIDLMLRLSGERPRAVAAVGSKVATRGTAFRYDDFAAATFLFDSGLVGRITANFGCVHRHQHVVRVFGTRATFILDDQGPRFFESREGDARRIELAPLPAGKGDLIPDLVAAIARGADPEPAALQELRLVEACVAADRALVSGEVVTIGGSTTA